MIYIQTLLFALVAASGTALVLTRKPEHQVIVSGLFGLALTLLFFALHSPDVALAAIVVSAVGLPLMLVMALARVRANSR